MQHCTCDARVGVVVSERVALNGSDALHVLHDGVLHVERIGQIGNGRAITSLRFLEVHIAAERQAVQRCMKEVVDGFHLLYLLALSAWSLSRFKFYSS